MKVPTNQFKAALRAGRQQIGVWNSISGNMACEIMATCGFDWVLIDTEHSPVEATEVLPALQTLAGYPDVSAVVRPAVNDTVLIKRMLDMGAQSLLLPYIESEEEAEAAVRAMRYGPRGVRGAASHSRATGYGKIADYATAAEAELCLTLQCETITAINRIEEIATVDGVDGIFIGPADLAASMGLPGQGGNPEVKAVIKDAIGRLVRIGVPAGMLSIDDQFTRDCIDWGTTFTAVGVDMISLERAATELAARFK